MLKKKSMRIGVVLTSLSLAIGSTSAAQAAYKSNSAARVGDDCYRLGSIAKARGVDGTNLICMVVSTGSFKGTQKWWYPDLKPLKNIDWTVPANPGGYSLTSNAISDTLKAEGLLSTYSSVYKPGAGGAVGLAAFQEIKGKSDAALITGIAMVGGLPSNKSTLELRDSTPIAKVMREYDAIVVPANSKYRNLQQLLADIKANPGSVPIAGGNKGGIDHQVMGLLAQTQGIKATALNYVVYSGGTEVIASVLSGATKAAISGSSEFAAYVASGKLRALGISSAKPLKTFRAKTFISQGVKLVYGNWRGVMAPADISEADRLNFAKVMDAMHSTPTWLAVVAANNWDNEFAAGNAFKAFLDEEVPLVYGVIKELGI
ncbi:MAG: tripartite tricarboxylate transporter substrate-binding protein [Candidatus Nanopelagicaceae bacterium]